VGTTSDGTLQSLASTADAESAGALLTGLSASVLPALRACFAEDGSPGSLPAGRAGGPYQAFLAPADGFTAGGDGETAKQRPCINPADARR
jgi:hypothetical protein